MERCYQITFAGYNRKTRSQAAFAAEDSFARPPSAQMKACGSRSSFMAALDADAVREGGKQHRSARGPLDYQDCSGQTLIVGGNLWRELLSSCRGCLFARHRL